MEGTIYDYIDYLVERMAQENADERDRAEEERERYEVQPVELDDYIPY